MNKKINGLILLLVLIAVGVYLNRSYAHIYDEITMVNLMAPKYLSAYVLGNKAKAAENVYVALGDSLTAGVGVDTYELSYPYLVARSLADRAGGATLINQSFSGARSADIINLLLDETIEKQPDIVTILIGTNDVHGDISLAAFTKNYEDILSRLTQETKARVYAISIPYLGSGSLIRPPYNYYFPRRIRSFNEKIERLAKRYGVQYIDLYTSTTKVSVKDGPYYAADSFHPSADGYALWAPIIYDRFNQ